MRVDKDFDKSISMNFSGKGVFFRCYFQQSSSFELMQLNHLEVEASIVTTDAEIEGFQIVLHNIFLILKMHSYITSFMF